MARDREWDAASRANRPVDGWQRKSGGQRHAGGRAHACGWPDWRGL